MKRLMLLTLLIISCNAWTQPSLTLLTHEEPPFVYRDQNNNLTGYAVELVRGIQRRLDNEEPILLNPWARAYMRATEQGNVLIFPLVRNAEREPLFHWIMPLTRNLHAVFANNTPEKITTLAQLQQLSAIGVQRGDFRESLLIEAGITNLVSYTTWKQAVSALIKGRVDGLFFSAAGLDYYCRQLEQDCGQFSAIYTHDIETTYIALSRQGVSGDEAGRWQQAARDFRASQAFAQLRQTWLPRIHSEHGLTVHYADGALNLWAASQAVHP
jgi:polar amino acid transport system substrate-binding protein